MDATLNGNGVPGDKTLRDLERTKREIELTEAKIRLASLQRYQRHLEEFGSRVPGAGLQKRDIKRRGNELKKRKSLVEAQFGLDLGLGDWVDAYADIVDIYRDSFQFSYPISTPNDRRAGQNFPFFINEIQLGILRASSRILCTSNSYAIGIMEGLTSFVIGDGYSYEPISKEKKKPGPRDNIISKDPILSQIGEVLEAWQDYCRWEELETELFWRSREDGEFFVLMMADEDGQLAIRTIEPEQVMQGRLDFAQGSFGIETPEDDVQNVISYHVRHLNNPAEDDDYTPEDVLHFKNNTKRSIKRGMPDFVFDAFDACQEASKLRRNMGEGAALQAAIAVVLQYEGQLVGQVQALSDSLAEFTTVDTLTGQSTNRERYQPGGILRVPKGQEYVNPPTATNAAMHVEVLQAILQSAGARWNAPTWLASGSQQEMAAYTAAEVAQSPFGKKVKRESKRYKSVYRRINEKVLEYAVDQGRLPQEAIMGYKLQVESPTLEDINQYEEAQTNQIYQQGRIKSPQTIQQELGLDPDQERTNFEEFDQMSGLGSVLDLPPQVAASLVKPAAKGNGNGNGKGQTANSDARR